MENIGGLLILVVFCMVILFVRHKISTGNNEFLKKAQKVGDMIVWVRAIMGLLFVSVLIFFLSKAGKH